MTALRARCEEAWLAWLAAAGPWQRWVQCLPLWGPGLDELEDPERLGRRRAGDARADGVADQVARLVEGTEGAVSLPLSQGERELDVAQQQEERPTGSLVVLD